MSLMSERLNDTHALSVSVLRGGRGLSARRPARLQPNIPLELYAYEFCPHSKKVREVLSELDLEYISRSCAHGSPTRATAAALGGKTRFPFLFDPNTGRRLYESESIIDYLHDTYGSGRGRLDRLVAPVNTLSAIVASVIRPRGRKVSVAASQRWPPEPLLVLYNFEASPYCRKVRETLCELGLDAHVKNVAKRSARRPELVARGGKMQVPYLIDPNTGTELYESTDIVDYLTRVYG